MELERRAGERMRLRGSDRDKAERLKREMRWHEPQRSYPRASPAEANRLPVWHVELWKKIKRLPAGVRRIRQTRKVCLKEEVKFRGEEKRGKMYTEGMEGLYLPFCLGEKKKCPHLASVLTGQFAVHPQSLVTVKKGKSVCPYIHNNVFDRYR